MIVACICSLWGGGKDKKQSPQFIHPKKTSNWIDQKVWVAHPELQLQKTGVADKQQMSVFFTL